MATTSLNVNGKAVSVTVDDPDMPLLYVLRDDLGLHGPRFGCGLGQCGACTVHVDGTGGRGPACTPLSARSASSKVVTLEGLGTPENPHPVQTRLHRGAGGAVRLLHQRHDHAGGRLPGREPKPSEARGQDRRSPTISADAARMPRIVRAVMRAAARREGRRCMGNAVASLAPRCFSRAAARSSSASALADRRAKHWPSGRRRRKPRGADRGRQLSRHRSRRAR